jgi:hypothetical protein
MKHFIFLNFRATPFGKQMENSGNCQQPYCPAKSEQSKTTAVCQMLTLEEHIPLLSQRLASDPALWRKRQALSLERSPETS